MFYPASSPLRRKSAKTRLLAWFSVGGKLTLLLLLLSLLFSCNGSGTKDKTGREGTGPDPEESVPVKVILPQKGDIALYLHATTSILAKNKAEVYAKMVGFCEKILVEEGDPVKKGTMLAQLGDREIRLALDQSKARLGKVKKDAERSQTLFSEGLISKQMNQDLSLQLRLARADYELASKRLEDASIVAPIEGVITHRSVKVGDLVTTTQPLFKIEDLKLLEAEVHIPEQDFLKVRPGQKAELLVDAFPNTSFLGTVERVNPVIDSQSGTAEATIAIENPQGLLRPGMFLRVKIVTDIHKDTWIIPKEAVLIQGDRKAVFVVRDEVAREVFIRTGFQDADRVEVLEGLTPEEPVVVMGHLGLQGETKVRVIE
jgi:membrane fusion protein (multidrug efflux system)